MKKIALPLIAGAIVSLGTASAYAASTNVNANVDVAVSALQITTTAQLAFGSFEIISDTASGTISVSRQGDATTSGTGFVYNGGQSTAVIRATGAVGATIDVNCTSSAVLTHESDATQTMSVSNVSIGGVSCVGGISGALITSEGFFQNRVYGNLAFDSPIGGSYSTANPGGTPITVDVVYQ